MANVTQAELDRYTSQPVFTDPAISTQAARRSVPDDVWRSLEMVPGAITWGIFLSAVVLSFVAPAVVAYGILLFDVYWLVKSISMSHSLIRAYRYLKRDTHIDWQDSLRRLGQSPERYQQQLRRQIRGLTGDRRGASLALWNLWQLLVDRTRQQEYRELRSELALVSRAVAGPESLLDPSEIYHLVVIATYTEELDILRPSFQALADAKFDHDRLIVVLATEERDRVRARANAAALRREFGRQFRKFIVTEHPANITGEVRGKGSNISWASRQAYPEIKQTGLKPEQVIVTSLDADHRPHPQYFAALTYRYVLEPHRRHLSFQPTPLFHNNLWHTTAINRVIATGSSFWHMVESTRAYRLRNFAAHSQPLQTLLDTDWWSVDTIVEDGQQYWRTYFAYHGNHFVVPVYVPIYQDAVLGDTYLKTLRAQYIQLRRWAWGSSDFPYIVINSLRDKSIPWDNKLTQIGRFLEGHISWATAPILLTVVAYLPTLLSESFRESLFGQTLAPTASLILTLALVGIVVTIFTSMLLLPPKPPEYSDRRHIWMLTQWALMPITTIFFSSLPAIEAQTRLMLGQYLEFRVTEKSSGPMGRPAEQAR